MKTAFLGLGVMGYPMAGHLHAWAKTTTVYNRTQTKSQHWIEQHAGDFAPTPKAAVKDADYVALCLGNDDDVRSVVYGADGVLAGLQAGSILVDHTTTSAVLATELSKVCAAQDVAFLDAPVSGGQSGAEQGSLTIMVGGAATTFASAQQVMQQYGATVTYMGKSGNGQLAKMCNQICIAGLVQALSEALRFAENNELDGSSVLDTVSQGAAQSWQMINRGPTMLQRKFDYGFAVEWMIKDLNICIEQAKKSNSALPITDIVKTYYDELAANGHSRSDTSSLITLLP